MRDSLHMLMCLACCFAVIVSHGGTLAWAGTSFVDGISDKDMASWDLGTANQNYFKDIFRSQWMGGGGHIKYSRYVAQWDLMKEAFKGPNPNGGHREQFEAWYYAAKELGLSLDVSLVNYNESSAGHPPSPGDYKIWMEALLNQFPGIKYVEAWNEPNLKGVSWSIKAATVAAGYANEVGKYCQSHGCVEIEGNFSDEASIPQYESEYIHHLNSKYETNLWGVHVYGAIRNQTTHKIEEFVHELPNRSSDQVWLTEGGALTCQNRGKLDIYSETQQAKGTRWLVKVLIPELKPAHVFYYSFMVGDGRMTEFCGPRNEPENTALYEPSPYYAAGGDPYTQDSPRPAARYIYDNTGKPWTFTGGPPTKAMDVATPNATLSGSVYPGGFRNAEYYFEYWLEGATSHSKTSVGTVGFKHTFPGGNTTLNPFQDVKVRLTNLNAGSKYFYRLVARPAKGTSAGAADSADAADYKAEEEEPDEYGETESFKTQPKPEAVTEAPTSVSQVTEVLKGRVNPEELDTKYWFQYGRTASYGSTFDMGDAGNGTGSVSITATLSGLQGDTTYHYRIVAESSAGTAEGPDVEFHTTAWDTMTLPSPSGAKGMVINGVSCAAPSACAAVGYAFNEATSDVPVSDWWDGTLWGNETLALPSSFVQGALSSVSCTTTSSCLGVGWYEDNVPGDASIRKTAAIRRSGGQWTFEQIATPEHAEVHKSTLHGVSCKGADFCMAAGETDAANSGGFVNGEFIPSGATEPFGDVWDGTSWRVLSMPQEKFGSNGYINGVSCVTSTFCVAVGATRWPYRQAMAERWTGSEWRLMNVSSGAGVGSDLLAVSCSSTTQCTAVGTSPLWGSALVEQWNGSSWSFELAPSPPGSSVGVLNGVSCVAGPVCTAVGSYDQYSFSDVWAGGMWSYQPVGNPASASHDELMGVSCLSSTECVAGGTLWSEGIPSGFADLVGPDVETQPAVELTGHGARLEGVVNPLGLQTGYRFEYGQNMTYGSSLPAPAAEAGSGTVDERESFVISGLTPETTYHYRIVAETTTGRVSYGEDAEFTTAPLVPSVTVVPALSGASLVENEAVSISNGSWTYKPGSYAYQWERCNSAGAECAPIAEATLSSYTPGEEDVGNRLRVAVTATNVVGSTSTVSAVSDVVALGVPLSTSRPELSSYAATPGTEVTVGSAAWTGNPSYAYQWQVCNKEGIECANISGATGSTETLTESQVGGTVRAEVTATNAAGSASAPTLPTEVIEAPSNTEVPAVSSLSPVEDVPLSVSTGTWKGYPAPTYTYQWERCNGFGSECVPIEEAISETYTPGEEDLGHTLRAEVIATNGAGEATAASSVSGLVVQEAPVGVELPSVSGEPTLGTAMTVTTGAWTDRPTSYAYQWFDCNPSGGECAAIVGATSSTYTPVRSDVGASLAVQVTATNAVGASLPAQSAPTTVVTGAPANIGVPVLASSNAYYNVASSVGNGSWSAYPVAGFSYQWQRCSTSGTECANISGATSSSYTPVMADVGGTVRAVVEATNSVGKASAASPVSGVVAGLPTMSWSTNTPANDGSTDVSVDTLNASVSSASTSALSSLSCSLTSRYPDGVESSVSVACATTNGGSSGTANWAPEYFACSASAYQTVDPEAALTGASKTLPYGVTYTYTVSASNLSGASTLTQSWSPERCAMQWKSVAAHSMEGGELPFGLGGYSSYTEAVLAHKYEYASPSQAVVTVEDNAASGDEHAWYVEAYVNGALVGKLSNLNVRSGQEYEPLSVLVPAGGNLELRGNLYSEAKLFLSASALNVTGGSLTIGAYTSYAEAVLAHKYEYSSPTEAVITAQDYGAGSDEHPWYVEAYVNGVMVGKLSNLNVRSGYEYEPLSVLVPAGGNLELRGNLYTEAKVYLSTSALSVSGGALTMGAYSSYAEGSLAHKYEYSSTTEAVITAQDYGAGSDEHPWYVEAYVNGVMVGKLSNLNVRSGYEYEPLSVLVPAGGTLELRGNLYSEAKVYLSASSLSVVGTGPLNFGPYSAFAEASLAHKYEYSAATEAVVTVEDNGLSGDEHPWYVEAYVNGVMAGKLSNLNVRYGQEYETLSVLVPAGGNLELRGNLYTEAKVFLSTSSWTETGGSVTIGGYTAYTEATLAHKYTYSSPTEAVITAEDNAKNFDEEPWYVEAYVNGSLVGKLSNLDVRSGQEYEPLSVLVPANGTLELRGNLYKEGKVYLSTSSVTVSSGTFTVGARTPYSEGSLSHKYEYSTASEVAVTAQDNGSGGDEHPWYVEAYVGGVLVGKLSNLNVRSGTEDEALSVLVPANGNLELRGNLYTEAKVFLSSSTLTVSGLGEGVVGSYTAYAPGRPTGNLTKAYCLTYSASSGEYSAGAGGSGESTSPAWGNCSPTWGNNTGTSTPVSIAWQSLASTGASCLYLQTASVGGITPVVAVEALPHETDTEFNAATGNSTCPAVASPQAPAAVEGSPPTISPTSPHVGVAETATKGSWTYYPSAYTYQWQQCNTTGEACTTITGATASSYTPVVGNANHTLRVAVTASNPLGSASATSPATGLVSGAPENKTLPTISSTTSGANGWSTPQTIDGTSSFNSISCPSTSLCVAVDAAKDILTTTNGGASWSLTSASSVFPYQPPSGVSCSSTVFCAAFDGNANLATSTNPTGGSSAWTYSGTPIPGNVSKTSCVSSSLCFMIEAGTVGWSTTPATGSSWKYESLGSNTLNSISCPTSTFCAAVDNAGNLVTSTNPTGGASAWSKADIDGTTALKGISCPTSSFCAAVDSTGNLLTSTNPTGGASAWSKTNIDATNTLNSISCATSAFCAAVDSTGHALTSTSPTGGASAWTSTTADASASLTSVSCGSAAFCVAVDNTGHATVFYEGLTTMLSATNGTWTNEPTGYTYQWKRCNGAGEECTNIEGATSSNHIVIPTDNAHTIRAAVTASNAAGATSATSTQTGTVVTPGEITEYALPASSKPYGIVKGPDSNMWFTDEATGKVGKITTSGSITEYATNNDAPEGITSGPDGNVWLVEHSVRNIDHITTGGSLTTYTLVRTSTYNVGIVTGGDGNLWFTESNTNYVAKINTNNEGLAEYALPAGSKPYGITNGPDGNLWFVDFATSKVGKITTTGTITEYGLPSGSQPYWITTGPDGNLWFTESGTNKIGRITTTGTITEYTLPTGSQPYGITAGSDGALWFTDHHTNKIGRITTAGSIAEVPLPTGSEPIGIAPGPNNNLWYTNYTTNKIGQITP